MLDLLIVDDDPADRLILRRTLEGVAGLAATIREAGDRASAEREFERQAPHLLLLDVRLGLDSGIEWLEALRRRGCRDRVVLLTGMEDPGTREAAARLDATVFSKNELDRESLAALLRSLGLHGAGAPLSPAR